MEMGIRRIINVCDTSNVSHVIHSSYTS